MKLYVFTVYDSAAEVFMHPFYMQSRATAIRAFRDTIERPDHQFAKHPADFTLMEIGTYDDSTGLFTQLQAKENLGTALEHLAAMKNEGVTNA